MRTAFVVPDLKLLIEGDIVPTSGQFAGGAGPRDPCSNNRYPHRGNSLAPESLTIAGIEQRIIVIGAGAAGIMASWRAASLGAKVTLLEKTARIGTKILISGGGKCNICHDGPMEDVLRAFRPEEARFIRPSCYRFPNSEIVKMLTSQGLKVYTRPDGRIFPSEGSAKDVVGILKTYLVRARVDIQMETPVTQVVQKESGFEVLTPRGTWTCSRLIVSTGGSSYPNSGTTGDGWPWVKSLGHTIVPIRAALAPINLVREGMDPRAGVALRDVVLKARAGKVFAKWRGDLLFTHRGISGPCALGISREVTEKLDSTPVDLEVDLVPDRNPEELARDLAEWLRSNPKKRVASFLDGLVPSSLIGELAESANLGDVTSANLAAKSRNRLVEVLKGWSLGRVKQVPLDKGECVAGGVSLDEVNPQTMESKLVPRLYLCGELLDVAGPVGGYNLQAAFATGYVAGESAAASLEPA